MFPEVSPILGDQRSIRRTMAASLFSICMEAGNSLSPWFLSQGLLAISRISESMCSYARLCQGEFGVGEGGVGRGLEGVVKALRLASFSFTCAALACAQTGQVLEPARWVWSQWIHVFMALAWWFGCLWLRGHFTLMFVRSSAWPCSPHVRQRGGFEQNMRPSCGVY